VVANTVSVTEERKTEEIHETPQSSKDAVAVEVSSEESQQPCAVVDVVEPVPSVEDAASGTQHETEPTSSALEEPVSPASPESPTGGASPGTEDGGKKGKDKSGSGRFSLFGKKKKKSSSEAEDLKNVSEHDDRQKRSSVGRKNKSPKSSESFDDGEKRSSGGPFSFLKRNKAKPCSKVPGSESAPALDLDDDAGGDATERIVYELEVEGNVVAKVRPRSSATDAKGRSSTAVEPVDEAAATAGRPFDAGKYLVVVAIDFGTTFSGYAFSFVPDDDDESSSERPIHMMRRWEGGDPGVINQKTLTALLLTPEGQFHAFGFGARNYYHDLDPTDAQRWMYFDKFKMALHSNPV